MIPLDYVLATALLAAPAAPAPLPPNLVACAPSENEPPLGTGLGSLAPTIAALAIQGEVMDRRESSYLLANPDEFLKDLALIRKRYHNLADAPNLHDSARFPDRHLISELLEFNRAYRSHLLQRQEVEGTHREELAVAVQETDHLYKIWDAVRDARSECYYVYIRRQALKTLREMIGPEAYHRGTLPPSVPIWRFARRD
jgi:hypothetical protein